MNYNIVKLFVYLYLPMNARKQVFLKVTTLTYRTSNYLFFIGTMTEKVSKKITLSLMNKDCA